MRDLSRGSTPMTRHLRLSQPAYVGNLSSNMYHYNLFVSQVGSMQRQWAHTVAAHPEPEQCNLVVLLGGAYAEAAHQGQTMSVYSQAMLQCTLSRYSRTQIHRASPPDPKQLLHRCESMAGAAIIHGCRQGAGWWFLGATRVQERNVNMGDTSGPLNSARKGMQDAAAQKAVQGRKAGQGPRPDSASSASETSVFFWEGKTCIAHASS